MNAGSNGTGAVDVGVARVEGKIKATLSIRINTNVHHYVLSAEPSLTFQVEDDGHVVLVVSGIKSGNVYHPRLQL